MKEKLCVPKQRMTITMVYFENNVFIATFIQNLTFI
jgi:hypothetical protein